MTNNVCEKPDVSVVKDSSFTKSKKIRGPRFNPPAELHSELYSFYYFGMVVRLFLLYLSPVMKKLHIIQSRAI